eukprot:6178812-Pleurochrysis_carterae.AAC.1
MECITQLYIYSSGQVALHDIHLSQGLSVHCASMTLAGQVIKAANGLHVQCKRFSQRIQRLLVIKCMNLWRSNAGA